VRGAGRPPRIVYAVTHPMTARYLLTGQLDHLRRAGFEPHLVASPGPELDEVARRERVAVHPVPMEREMSPGADALALARLVALFRRLRPDLVNAGTPKAGLLAIVAARLARVPVRVYTLRGLRLETASGPLRRVLATTERIAAGSAHRVVCVSESLRCRAVALGLVPADKTTVLADGSSNGVDPDRFRRDAAETEILRRRLGIPGGVPVVGFVGRLTRDKGVEELAGAYFGPVLDARPDARLLLVGGFESGDPVPETAAARLREDPRVVVAGFVGDAAPYYPLMDVLAFPSRREGFPNVPLEAAAAGRPVAGFAATGTVDAVVDGVTGTLVPVGDPTALAQAVTAYFENPELARRHGAAGRERVERRFRSERVWEAWADEYRRLLDRRPAPARPGRGSDG